MKIPFSVKAKIENHSLLQMEKHITNGLPITSGEILKSKSSRQWKVLKFSISYWKTILLTKRMKSYWQSVDSKSEFHLERKLALK